MKKFGFLLFALLALVASCKQNDSPYIDPRGTDFAGDQSCIQCHAPQHKSWLADAHSSSTALATEDNVLGKFNPVDHEFKYDEHTKLVMEKRHDGFYQVVYLDGKETAKYKFDIVFGSKNAQTSAYWKDGQTYELPVSYYKSADAWGSSPGFPDDRPFFGRIMEKDCYACHASNVNNRQVTTASDQRNISSMDIGNSVNPETAVFGIDCERCHGPAKSHVDHHIAFPTEKKAFGIASFKLFTNTQKNDACSICHSGIAGMKIKSRFEFKPGDNLFDYYRPSPDYQSANHDVHGNQAQLLGQSKCFIKSQTLNCTSCHDSHQENRQTIAGFTKICMDCHKTSNHGNMDITQRDLEKGCIDCHMPKQASKAINFRLSGSKDVKSYELRTHKIAIYQ
ncbi:MAG: hypothetical protein EOO50_17050 [Flavobacterium sp.]|uniref:hypothetical protein n=1 Tax=Flavobacterium sp. TaxID=239 RepID=UPI0011FD0327|nr:hypothetical protein [Flavobacterium sp.]RZJ63315.1 MAG: hypothetical protein EOO50_17050 [Flavobacterium sp.]